MSLRHPHLLSRLLFAIPSSDRRRLTTASTPRQLPPPNQDSVTTIIALGDMQRTSLVESRVLRRHQHDREREMLVREIVAENPDLLLLLGDQVCYGENAACWRDFDAVIEPVADAGIPVFALLGNHDYDGRTRKGALRHFEERFPGQAEARAALLRFPPVAIITLDSNLDRLKRKEVVEQNLAYRALLTELDADPAIRGVIVASHHPPYSNGGYSHRREIAPMFARPFLDARKTLLYLSGHVHSYQRFQGEGKAFVVSGGGGGPRHMVKPGLNRAPFPDESPEKGGLRRFHYVVMTVGESGVLVETRVLEGEGMETGDRFELSFAAA